MPPSLPDLVAWDALSATECETIARDLVTALPTGTTFDRVEPHSLGGQSRHVAFFLFEDERFALIPGGPIELGYDRARPYPFSAAMLENWKTETQEEYGLPHSLEDILDVMLTPHRVVPLRPFLISAAPKESDFKKFKGTVNEKSAAKFSAANGLNGPWRLPTPEQWEHACAAGTRTLFRWGNDCPTDEISYGAKNFTAHTGPNAFGLTFIPSTYKVELCAGGILRGGDGGGTVCGGLGTVATWLPFASAYQDHPDVVAQGFYDTVFIRRVFEIPER